MTQEISDACLEHHIYLKNIQKIGYGTWVVEDVSCSVQECWFSTRTLV